ncbi:MAG: hypothetical protein RBU45_14710 [Myxococcota bacterium]|jgi:hypothetical protein|nr:hypothetical protein [Myxococcota bacterium]
MISWSGLRGLLVAPARSPCQPLLDRLHQTGVQLAFRERAPAGEQEALLQAVAAELGAPPDLLLWSTLGRFARDPGAPAEWGPWLDQEVAACAALCLSFLRTRPANRDARIVLLFAAALTEPAPDDLFAAMVQAALQGLLSALARLGEPRFTINGVQLFDPVDPRGAAGLGADEELLTELVRTLRFLVEEGDFVSGVLIPLDGARSSGEG